MILEHLVELRITDGVYAIAENILRLVSGSNFVRRIDRGDLHELGLVGKGCGEELNRTMKLNCRLRCRSRVGRTEHLVNGGLECLSFCFLLQTTFGFGRGLIDMIAVFVDYFHVPSFRRK